MRPRLVANCFGRIWLLEDGVLEGIRTPDPRFRKPVLYPAELPRRLGWQIHRDGDFCNVGPVGISFATAWSLDGGIFGCLTLLQSTWGNTLMIRSLMTAAVLTAALAGHAFAGEAASCKTVKVAEPGWNDLAFTTGASMVVLKALGYDAQSSILGIEVIYQSMKDKDLDAFLGYWDPSMVNYYKAYKEDGSVETIVKNLEGAKYTFAVPTYAWEAGRLLNQAKSACCRK
jgi:hypothetical protein